MLKLFACICLQVVDQEDDSSSGGTESPATQSIDLDDGLQDSLCKLWDMSMNAVSQLFIQVTN